MGEKSAKDRATNVARQRDPVPTQDQRELCYDSLGVCGKPGCGQVLNIRTVVTGVLTTVGEMAHIIAAQDNGPRGDPSLPAELRERYANLILLCPVCHLEVDNPANFSAFPKELLRQWKKDQQQGRAVAVTRARQSPKIAELAALLDGLAIASPLIGDSFDRTDLAKKIKVNKLSAHVAATIARSVALKPTVDHQIEAVERSRPNYGNMITAKMAAEWLTLADKGIGEDAAYDRLKDMLMFAEGRTGSEGVVDIVLAYFFQVCTIMHRS